MVARNGLPSFPFTTAARVPFGEKRDLNLVQSRGLPAGPDMTSYSAATIVSTDLTSSGLASGSLGAV